MNFKNDNSFLELVSDGDQINLSSNAVPPFESRKNEPRQAKTQNPKNSSKFRMSLFPPSKEVHSKISYRTRLGAETSLIFDENDEGVQMLKSRNIKRFS